MSALTPIVVTLKSDSEVFGTVVSEHLLQLQTKDGKLTYSCKLGVCWDDKRVPAISYHDPEELEWISIPSMDQEDE